MSRVVPGIAITSRHLTPTAPSFPPPQIVPNFRVRTIPVLGPTPALFGMAAAGFILCQLAGAPFDGEPLLTLTALQYDRAMERLVAREEEAYGTADGVRIDRDDVSRRPRSRAAFDANVLPGRGPSWPSAIFAPAGEAATACASSLHHWGWVIRRPEGFGR
jgi:hypothetical protein